MLLLRSRKNKLESPLGVLRITIPLIITPGRFSTYKVRKKEREKRKKERKKKEKKERKKEKKEKKKKEKTGRYQRSVVNSKGD